MTVWFGRLIVGMTKKEIRSGALKNLLGVKIQCVAGRRRIWMQGIITGMKQRN